jgi:hypothetical protein
MILISRSRHNHILNIYIYNLFTKALKQFKVSGISYLKDLGFVTRLSLPISERCSDRRPKSVLSLTAQPITPTEGRGGKTVVG